MRMRMRRIEDRCAWVHGKRTHHVIEAVVSYTQVASRSQRRPRVCKHSDLQGIKWVHTAVPEGMHHVCLPRVCESTQDVLPPQEHAQTLLGIARAFASQLLAWSTEMPFHVAEHCLLRPMPMPSMVR